IRYESQFEDEIYIGSDGSFDPNLDQIAYEWRDASGKILGTEQSLDVPLLDPGTYAYTLIVRDPFGAESSATTILTIAPFKEPGGFHTRFAARNPVGAWRAVADATAAQQERVWHPDAGAPKVTTASAAPASYVDVAVVADPTQQYKLWMRLLAQTNHWANDSVFVQFQHGVITADGQTRYRVGTTDALEINLEQCSGCGISGWGWRDERWGAALNSPPKLLRFPKGGSQFIRIQTREDGVSFDQIVLSAEKYRDVPPGPAKNDKTVVPPWWW
ncbi:MAG TPA: hypothetical protein VG106_01300, partial [Vicinamibacterales bacterium]|nr:hypothetical protein [Vicinamibacterales bacterium]